jgi:hypothetical protein
MHDDTMWKSRDWLKTRNSLSASRRLSIRAFETKGRQLMEYDGLSLEGRIIRKIKIHFCLVLHNSLFFYGFYQPPKQVPQEYGI